MAAGTISAHSGELETRATQSVLKKLISFPAMLGAILVLGIYLPMREFILDPDVWWHIKVGEVFLATHRLPTIDTYSQTAPHSYWLAYEWLGDVLLAAVHNLAGFRGLLGLDVALGGATLVGLYVLGTIRSGNSKAGFAVAAVFLPLAAVSYSLRPQMVGYFLLVVTLIVLELFHKGHQRLIWLLPPIFLIWGNTHGSFFFGLFALGVCWMGGVLPLEWLGLECRRWNPAERVRLSLVFLLSLVALVITPYGVRLAAYPFDMAFAQPVNVANIKEWQPMPFNMFEGKLFLVLVLAFLLAQATFRPRWRVDEWGLFLVGLGMACLHARFMLLFVPFATPLFAATVARWFPPYSEGKDHYALNVIIMLAAVVGIVATFPKPSELVKAVEVRSPVKAVAFLREHPAPVPMYNNYGFGGYLIWSMSDRNKVFIDGRADIYERVGVLSDYLDISRLKPNAMLLLDAYNVQSALVERDESIATVLRATPGWAEIYDDKLAALFVRRRATTAATAPSAAGHEGSLTPSSGPPPVRH